MLKTLKDCANAVEEALQSNCKLKHLRNGCISHLRVTPYNRTVRAYYVSVGLIKLMTEYRLLAT